VISSCGYGNIHGNQAVTAVSVLALTWLVHALVGKSMVS
jgi:hypothetical protein